MNRKIFVTLTIFMAVAVAYGHEFWLQPKKFLYTIGETMSVDFLVGENFKGENWDLKKHKVVRLDQVTTDKSISLLNAVKPGDGNNLSVTFQEEGTFLYAMQSNNAFIKLDAEKFNAYLKEDGLDEILEQRSKTNTLTDSASEHYMRCAKLLVQVGDKATDVYQKVIGLPLEIIPLNNPYATKMTDEISFKVLFNGKPLSFTLVKVWNKSEGRTFIQNLYTEKNGIITTRRSNDGSWMVSTVKMVPSKEASANWQSYWASLVFGYNK